MKKISIILALIMALSCFSVTAFAANNDTDSATSPAKIEYTIAFEQLDGTIQEIGPFFYDIKAGSTLTSANILDAAKSRLDDDGKSLIDTEEYDVSDVVISVDENGKYAFSSIVVESGETYEFVVRATEINDVKNFAITIADQFAALNWSSIVETIGNFFAQMIDMVKEIVSTFSAIEA